MAHEQKNSGLPEQLYWERRNNGSFPNQRQDSDTSIELVSTGTALPPLPHKHRHESQVATGYIMRPPCPFDFFYLFALPYNFSSSVLNGTSPYTIHPNRIPSFLANYQQNPLLNMSTAQEQNAINDDGYGSVNKEINGVNGYDHAPANSLPAAAAARQRKPYDYGGNPLAHVNTGDSVRLPAFGGEFQPGLYKAIADRKIANPAPLGLSAFALTTFVLSLINLGTRGITEPNIVVGAAFAYGGLVQLLAGMWYVYARLDQLRASNTDRR